MPTESASDQVISSPEAWPVPDVGRSVVVGVAVLVIVVPMVVVVVEMVVVGETSMSAA